ncbi:hypothetical protein [Fundidesulfovibrio putealis]|uniref:hypothetical protein n=1 Tax=Fundidesulfovibrio putealis TaxID=270496 RepID=UPI0012EC6036|nr:hypothetical protein [Fundidesulfovibrio putealis]
MVAKFSDLHVPDGYTPFGTIELCGNTIINGEILFLINTFIPLLIGTGKQPRIWLSGYAKNNAYPIQYIVDSKSQANFVHIKRNANKTKVKIESNNIITIIKTSADKITIPHIDLRPIGINIHGDTTELKVSNGTLRKNKFVNTKIMIKFTE